MLRKNNQEQRKKQFLMMAVLLSVAVALIDVPAAFANSAEPPMITIIVPFAPKDMEISVLFADGREKESVRLEKKTKGWESYYRFFQGGMLGSKRPDFEGAMLIVKSDEKNFESPLPVRAFEQYNNLFTLDLAGQTLTEGQNPARQILLILMRVIFTLLLEGVVFFLFGYRRKASWLTFGVINLITQGGLNILLSGPNMGSYWVFGYAFLEIIIFAAEMIAFAITLKEHKKRRAVVYVLTANLVSLVVGGMMIAYLPV